MQRKRKVTALINPLAIDPGRQHGLEVAEHRLPLLAEPGAGPADQLDQRILHHLGLPEEVVGPDGFNQVLILAHVLLDEAPDAGLQGAINRLEQVAARGELADVARDLVAAQTFGAAGQQFDQAVGELSLSLAGMNDMINDVGSGMCLSVIPIPSGYSGSKPPMSVFSRHQRKNP